MAISSLIEEYRRRTISRDLIIWLTIAVISTVFILIAIYYFYSTTVTERELNSKAESTADEIKEVLAISLWNLSHDVIQQISKAYLESSYIAGIQVHDDQGHVMFAEVPQKGMPLVIKERKINWKGLEVGTLKLWVTGKDPIAVQHAMIRAMMFIGVSVILIVILVTHFIMRVVLKKPMDQLIMGIRTIAGGDYLSSMESVPQTDINAIIKEANLMAHQIAERDELLKKEIEVRTKAEKELKSLNKTLEIQINQINETKKALIDSERKYRGIFENALEGIFRTTPKGRVIDANPSMAQIFGYESSNEFIKSVTDIQKQHYVNPNQRAQMLDLLKNNDSISNYECQMYRKDGTKIWIVLQIKAFYDDNGNINLLEGILQDITKRKKAEIELINSEKKYRELYEGSIDGYMMIDNKARFIECNSSFCSMLGYTLDELKNLSYLQITPNSKHIWEEKLVREQTIDRGYTEVYENEYIKKDGTIFPVEMRAYAIRDLQGNSIGFWAFSRDITQRKALEAEAMRNARLASLGELAAGVAHEINNPINGIINYAQILINRNKKYDMDIEIPERIIKEGERIEKIVRGLLSFSRERKEIKYSIKIQDIISESMDFIAAMLNKDDIKLILEVPDKIPEIKANPAQIQQVLLNIISNSRYALNKKYRGSHEDKLLSIKAEKIETGDGKKVRLTFHDKGTGIASNVIDRICDPFFSTKPPSEGTGLGLSISHGIIKDHQGALWAESEMGEYTNLIIELPL